MFIKISPVRFATLRFLTPGICLSLGLLVSQPVTATAQGNISGMNGTQQTTQAVIADYANNGLNNPGAVAVDPSGNIFIADTGNNRVIKLPWNSSTRSYGTQVSLLSNLFSPNGVALSANGSLFVADTGNNRVLELPWNPTTETYGQETVIGVELNTPKGIAVARNGSVLIADTGNNRVVEIPFDQEKKTYGPQTTVGNGLVAPEGVIIGDEGKVFIADTGNNSIVQIPTGCNAVSSCSTQTTVANASNNNLSSPRSLALTPSGSLFIAQPLNNQVILLPWNRTTSTYGTQIAVGQELAGPSGVTFDSKGNIYVADTLNNRVLKISPQQSGVRPQNGMSPMNGLSRRRPQ